MSAGLLMLALTGGHLLAAADSSRYKVEIAYTQKAVLGTSSQSMEAHFTGFLTLFQRDTTTGRIAEFRLDSLLLAPGKAIPPAFQGNTATARGLIYRGLVARGAVVGGFRLLTPHPQAGLLTQGLDNVYPGLRTLLKSGDSWSDTVRVNTAAPVVQDRTTIVNWKVVSLLGEEIVADAATTGKMVLTKNGTTSEITMTGTRHLTGPIAGPMTTAIVGSEQQQVTMSPDGQPIPVTVRTSMTITRLP